MDQERAIILTRAHRLYLVYMSTKCNQNISKGIKDME